MRAVVLSKYGAADVLKVAEKPVPIAASTEVVIRNHAVSVNPVDFKVRLGYLDAGAEKPAEPMIIGWDGAGVVVAAGAETKFQVGDAVWYTGDLKRTDSGSYAEHTVVDARLVSKMPQNLNYIEAAAMPLTFQTAYEALVEQFAGEEDFEAAKQKLTGKSLFVLNGAGGLGSAGVQLGKALGMYVVASASRAESQEYVTSVLGADLVLNHRIAPEYDADGKKIGGQTFKEQLVEKSAATAHAIQGVDFVLNAHDNDRIGELCDLLYTDGHLTITVPLAPQDFARINARDMLFKRRTLHWTFMFARALNDQEPERVGRVLQDIAKLTEQGVLKTTVSKTFDNFFEDIQAAHTLSESGKVMGKIVLAVPQVGRGVRAGA